MYEQEKACGNMMPKHDKSDIQISLDRISVNTDYTTSLIQELYERLEGVTIPTGPSMPSSTGGSNEPAIERARSQLDKHLTQQGDFINENNLKLRGLLDRLSL